MGFRLIFNCLLLVRSISSYTGKYLLVDIGWFGTTEEHVNLLPLSHLIALTAMTALLTHNIRQL